MRPGEGFKLRWGQVLLNGSGGLIQIAEGKSKAARRLLPVVPAVYQAPKAWREAEGGPTEGWVFPSGSMSRHLEEDSAKNQHAKALATLEKAHMENPDIPIVKLFEPHCLRHTALTRLTEARCDAFTLARIAGHSSITVTMRYCHPQADAIERAFAKVAGSQNMVTEDGHLEETASSTDEKSQPVTTRRVRG